MSEVTRISRDELARRLENGEVVAAEALPEGNFLDAHLPGAVNLPHDQVDELAPRVLPDKDRPVAVYCANSACKNSSIAARRLVQLGYSHVYQYEEGKQDWIEAGLAVERETEVA